MKVIQKAVFLTSIFLLAVNSYAGRWLSRDPVEFMERDPKLTVPTSLSVSPVALHDSGIFAPQLTYSAFPTYQQQANLYTYVENDPINQIDPLGLWTLGIGINGGYGFGFAGGINIGFYVGHGAGGWSWGVLGGPSIGVGTPSFGGGGFVQVTSAPCVAKLRGIGGAMGGSGGEGAYLGGDYVFGDGYQGGQFNFGLGARLPIPFEIHEEATPTIGPAWGAGSQ